MSARGFGNSIFGCLTLLQCARVVGASRSCRSRRYTLSSLLSVATLSSPGPRAQHPTSHRVGRLVTDDLAFDGNKFCVVADRCVRPHRRTEHIQSIEQRKCLSCFRWPLVGAGLCACPRWSFGHRGARAGVEACRDTQQLPFHDASFSLSGGLASALSLACSTSDGRSM